MGGVYIAPSAAPPSQFAFQLLPSFHLNPPEVFVYTVYHTETAKMVKIAIAYYSMYGHIRQLVRPTSSSTMPQASSRANCLRLTPH